MKNKDFFATNNISIIPYFKYLLYLGIPSLVIVFAILLCNKNKIEETYKVKIHDRVSSYFEYKGSLWIKVSATDDRYVFKYSENICNKPQILYNFLKVGDSIYKQKNSDTLLIYRNNLVFFFVLGETIEKPPISINNYSNNVLP